MQRLSRGKFGSPLLWVLLLAPAVVLLFKQLPLSQSDTLREALSLAGATGRLRHHLYDVMLVPLGAVIVALFRLTLGLRVLSFFRPILLAIAFRLTGFAAGLLMLCVALAVMTAFRPQIRGAYFARIAVSLSFVAALLLVPVVIGLHVHSEPLDRLAYFPVVALCLTCEAFAEILRKDGFEEALWRTITTVACAVVIVAVSRIPGLLGMLLRYPELVLTLAGVVLLIDRVLDFRVWNGLNPLRVLLRAAPRRSREKAETCLTSQS